MLSVGLVGLPNAGKSTLFNLITKRSVPAENFPFCTIDPSSGIVYVPDNRLDKLAEITKSKEIHPAPIEFTDIAGLVKNAHNGEGLGNQFLAHIQQVDLILLVVRCFEDENIIHVENRVDPNEDEEILLLELTSHDQQKLEKLLPKLEKESQKDLHSKTKINIVQGLIKTLSDIRPASSDPLSVETDEEILKWRKSLNLLTDKPVLKVANISAGGKNITYSGDFEIDILSETEFENLEPEERMELGLSKISAMDGLIQAAFKKLDLATYLTTGEKETKAWTFKKGMQAPDCAALIHTDFGKNFIKAEIVKYQDFVDHGGWKQAFDKGAVRSMGKDYYMEDGDVVEFKIGG